MDTILDIDVGASDNPDPSVADSEANGDPAVHGITISEVATDASANGIANGQAITNAPTDSIANSGNATRAPTDGNSDSRCTMLDGAPAVSTVGYVSDATKTPDSKSTWFRSIKPGLQIQFRKCQDLSHSLSNFGNGNAVVPTPIMAMIPKGNNIVTKQLIDFLDYFRDYVKGTAIDQGCAITDFTKELIDLLLQVSTEHSVTCWDDVASMDLKSSQGDLDHIIGLFWTYIPTKTGLRKHIKTHMTDWDLIDHAIDSAVLVSTLYSAIAFHIQDQEDLARDGLPLVDSAQLEFWHNRVTSSLSKELPDLLFPLSPDEINARYNVAPVPGDPHGGSTGGPAGTLPHSQELVIDADVTHNGNTFPNDNKSGTNNDPSPRSVLTMGGVSHDKATPVKPDLVFPLRPPPGMDTHLQGRFELVGSDIVWTLYEEGPISSEQLPSNVCKEPGHWNRRLYPNGTFRVDENTFVDQQDYRHPHHTYGNYQPGPTMSHDKPKASTKPKASSPNTMTTVEDTVAEAKLNLTGLKPTPWSAKAKAARGAQGMAQMSTPNHLSQPFYATMPSAQHGLRPPGTRSSMRSNPRVGIYTAASNHAWQPKGRRFPHPSYSQRRPFSRRQRAGGGGDPDPGGHPHGYTSSPDPHDHGSGFPSGSGGDGGDDGGGYIPHDGSYVPKEKSWQVKPDMSQYPELKDNADYPNWEVKVTAILSAQDLQNAVDPHYAPATVQAQANLQRQMAWVVAVMQHKVKTTTGKAIVRKYSRPGPPYDARAMMAALKADATASPSSILRQRNLRILITNARITPGKSQVNFLIALDHCIDRHNDFTERAEIMITPHQAKDYMTTAVHGADNLRAVATRELEQVFSHKQEPYSYSQYYALLFHSATLADGVPSGKTLNVNMSQLSDDELGSYLGTGDTYDESTLEAYAASRASNRPMLPPEVFKPLSDDGKRNWSKFSDTDRAHFTEAMAKDTSVNTHQLHVNNHTLDATAATDDTTDVDTSTESPAPTVDVNKVEATAKGPSPAPASSTGAHPGDPRRFMSQPSKVRPKATTTTTGMMARFESCTDAVQDLWGDSDGTPNDYWDPPSADPDFR